MKLSLLQSLKFQSFLFIIDCYWLESPVSVFFTEPRSKLDRYGPIIWYQSLGGLFQFRFRSGLYRKTTGDVKQMRCVFLRLFQIHHQI
ncbi:hypothetical protein HanRHA438_Chr11g0504261 [Helianthus annuus]|nr:hypothetical protein HanIR_Chr11g0529171 [Helianthus annuus]KAJ0870776.1 hypothetical protein HanRHA438_Chr11g0504261 [Helianthus annuus]